MSREHAYRAACARADEARERFVDSAQAAKERIAPARLKQDAVAKATNAARDGASSLIAYARQRPVAIGAALGGFGLYLARRPLAALFGRLYVHMRNTPPENSETDDG